VKQPTYHSPRRAGGLAMVTLAVLGLAGVGRAATPANQVPFKVTLTGPTDSFMIPVSPPVLSWKDSGAGNVPLLGAFTYVDHAMVQLDVAGKPISCTDGLGAFTTANGDGLFLTFSGLLDTASKPGLVLSQGVFTVTGGQGQFCGASGNGVVIMQIDPVKNMVNASWDGMLLVPKK
jgi:hypothetical protein